MNAILQKAEGRVIKSTRNKAEHTRKFTKHATKPGDKVLRARQLASRITAAAKDGDIETSIADGLGVSAAELERACVASHVVASAYWDALITRRRRWEALRKDADAHAAGLAASSSAHHITADGWAVARKAKLTAFRQKPAKGYLTGERLNSKRWLARDWVALASEVASSGAGGEDVVVEIAKRGGETVSFVLMCYSRSEDFRAAVGKAIDWPKGKRARAMRLADMASR